MLRHSFAFLLFFGLSLSQETGNLDALIESLFNQTPSANGGAVTQPGTVVGPNTGGGVNAGTPDELPPGVPEINDCPGGECVPYYLCANNSFVTDGEGLIDIRFNDDEPKQCHDYLETCCGQEDKVVDPIIPPNIEVKSGCGHRNENGIAFTVSEKYGEAQYGEFPWMVAVLKEDKTTGPTLNVYQCGGSLIHPQVILTAAHCVHGKTPHQLKIRAGEWDTQTKNELFPHQDRDVSEIIIHPQYYKGALYNDIALILINQPVEITETVQTACLPPANHISDGSRCLASGWGKDVFGRDGKYQVILKKIELPIVPHAQCQDSLKRTRLGRRFNLHNSFICAGGERGKDTCKGDGGSPLVCPIAGSDSRYYQAGIVAWGIGCGENQVPGVYANVASVRNWIDQQFHAKGLDSSYYTP